LMIKPTTKIMKATKMINNELSENNDQDNENNETDKVNEEIDQNNETDKVNEEIDRSK
ncbi:16427_t:CDS:1, partial [Gigaspora rosea]